MREPAAEPPVADPVVTEAGRHILLSRSRVAKRGRVRELLFGTQDGLLTSLGLISGVSGATTARYPVLVAGFAGAVAGMIAMGAGAYVAGKSQLEVHLAEIDREKGEVERNPERELGELVELFMADGLAEDDARSVAGTIARHPGAMVRVMAEKELGIVVEGGAPLREGAVIAAAFLVGAVVPILPWVFLSTTAAERIGGVGISPALVVSVGLTTLFLFGMGVLKAGLAHIRPVVAGAEIAGLGLAAALLAFLLGSVVPRLLGVSAAVGG